MGGYQTVALAGMLPALGILCGLFTAGKGKPFPGRISRFKGFLAVAILVLFFSFALVGCGASSSAQNTPSGGGQVTLLVTGTSGAITQSTPVAITIN